MTDDPRIGTALAGYRIEALLGRGGMGVVYRAEQTRLGRKVALKLLVPELAENEGFRVRFEHESRLAAAIDHPNIIPLYEAGEVDGLLFLTMRYVEGTDLKAVIAREPRMSPERALSVVGQLAGALDAAHGRGLVHRDVKPANVLVASGAGVESSDHCYLTDFGLTKDTSSKVELTATGQFVGTIDYVAPEQIQGTAPDGRTDLYALACVFYECLTGKPPFQRDNDVGVMWAHLQDDPPQVTAERPDLPAGLDLVIAKAMSKSAEDRYETCSAFVAAARAALDTGPAAKPREDVAGLTRPAARPAAGPPPLAVPAGATRLAGAKPADAPFPQAPARESADARERPRTRGLAVAGAIAAVALAAVGGVLAGGSGSGGGGAAVQAAGPLRLSLPAGWGQARSPGRIEGLELVDPVQVGLPSLDGRAALVAGPIARPGPGLLPRALARRLGDRSAPSGAVALGKANALTFPGLEMDGAPGRADLYVVPTAAGPIGLVCEAAPDAATFLRDCRRALSGVALSGTEAQDPRPDATYARSLGGALATQARSRTARLADLGRARTATAQVTAVRALATEQARLARRVAAVRAPAAARAAHRAIASAALGVASGYRSAASALAGRDTAAYRAGGRTAAAAQARLGRAVAALRQLGYSGAG